MNALPEAEEDDEIGDETGEDTQYWEQYEDDDTDRLIIPEADELNHMQYDTAIDQRIKEARFQNAQVALPRGDLVEYGTVKGLKRDAEGKNIGSYHSNPLMDNSMYEVEFQSGESEAFAANVISENIHSQVDEEG